jgi:hypothetical protein
MLKMRYFLLLLGFYTFNVEAQTLKKDYYINYPVLSMKEEGFLPLNSSDSSWVEDLAFEDTVERCFVMKYNDSNLVITYKEPRFDVVYIIKDNQLKMIYEIGKNHFECMEVFEED